MVPLPPKATHVSMSSDYRWLSWLASKSSNHKWCHLENLWGGDARPARLTSFKTGLPAAGARMMRASCVARVAMRYGQPMEPGWIAKYCTINLQQCHRIGFLQYALCSPSFQLSPWDLPGDAGCFFLPQLLKGCRVTVEGLIHLVSFLFYILLQLETWQDLRRNVQPSKKILPT